MCLTHAFDHYFQLDRIGHERADPLVGGLDRGPQGKHEEGGVAVERDELTDRDRACDREPGAELMSLELRRELASNSPTAIIQRHSARSAGSRGIYQGDPTRDRLDQLQRPPSSGSTP